MLKLWKQWFGPKSQEEIAHEAALEHQRFLVKGIRKLGPPLSTDDQKILWVAEWRLFEDRKLLEPHQLARIKELASNSMIT